MSYFKNGRRSYSCISGAVLLCLCDQFHCVHNLKQESADFSSKGPGSKYFWFCSPYSLLQLFTYLTLLLYNKSQRPQVNNWAGLCSDKLYLHSLSLGWIWSMGCGLLASDLGRKGTDQVMTTWGSFYPPPPSLAFMRATLKTNLGQNARVNK